jgi:hypothetical protein
VWTVIDAPPFELDARMPIHRLAGQMIRESDVPLDFRLVNIRELSVPVSDIVPGDAEVVFDKKAPGRPRRTLTRT